MHPYRVAPGTRVDLREHDPRDRGLFEGGKAAGKRHRRRLNERLEKLQELLYAENEHKLLVVLQALDTGGKDSTIRHVFEGVNPQGVRVARYGRPTERELHHDFLWRVHQHTPGNGEIVIFNRSHYEDVLVVRVHGLVSEARWRRRYEHINAFEKLLVDEGTTVLKLFLHISREEQKRRLQKRLERPDKHWKLDARDLSERAHWDEYMAAYEDVLSLTSTEHAPWYIIPGDSRWYRNVVVSELLVETLEGLEMSYPPAPEGLDRLSVDD